MKFKILPLTLHVIKMWLHTTINLSQRISPKNVFIVFYLLHFFVQYTVYIYCMFMTVKLCNNIMYYMTDDYDKEDKL